MGERSPAKQDQDYFSRRDPSAPAQTSRPRRIPSESFRSRLTAIQSPGSPTPPRTPRTPGLGRSLSSTFASPGLGFRQDDDFFIFEFSHRYLRAGLGGEAEPRSLYGFGPEKSRREGDYSRWLPTGQISRSDGVAPTFMQRWTTPHELWQMDLRNLDLGLVGDKIERALREAIRDHILVLDDAKKRKAVLVVPPLLPRPLLQLLCTKIFEIYPAPPSITLLSAAVLSTAAAGLRSALVVDIGWAATVVTAVYEYREVKQMSSCRAMKLLTWEIKEMLEVEAEKQISHLDTSKPRVSFEDAEEVVRRLCWARSSPTTPSPAQIMTIPIHTGSQTLDLRIPFTTFGNITETTLITSPDPNTSSTATPHDDNDTPLPTLIYTHLLQVPIDIRQTMLTRIIFTGGGSHLPGLKARILHDLQCIISTRGWDPVCNYGSAGNPHTGRKRGTMRRPDGPMPMPTAKEDVISLPSSRRNRNKDVDPDITEPASLQPQLADPILERLKARNAAPSKANTKAVGSQDSSTVDGAESGEREELRSIKSLGAWAGASLLTGLRVQGAVVVERDAFLRGLPLGVGGEEKGRRD